jgi:hypothetical protein
MNEVAWRKSLRDAEAASKAAGLTDRNVGLQFMVGPVIGQQQAPGPTEAIILSRPHMVKLSSGGLQKVAAESLTVSRLNLIYQVTAYTRWSIFFEKLQQVLRPPLRSALHAVRTANLRLEYRDSFRFIGSDAPTSSDLLREGSPLIAPHVFKNSRLWHSHTGFLEEAEGCDSRLIQVNVDSNEAMNLGDPANFRIVGITTAVQNNLLRTSADALDSEEALANYQLQMFVSMHERSKDIFKQLISDATAARVGLS